jgi:hypothetical protein
MALVGFNRPPFGVDLATSREEKPRRFNEDQQGDLRQQRAPFTSRSLIGKTETRIKVEHALRTPGVIASAPGSGQTGKRIELKSTYKWQFV